MSRKTNPNFNPGTRFYFVVMVICLYIGIYMLLMILAIAPNLEKGEMWPFFFVLAVPWLAAGVPMLILWVRYRREKAIRFDPAAGCRKFAAATKKFLFPYRYRCHPVGTEAKGMSRLVCGEGLIRAFGEEYREFFEGKSIGENVTQFYRHELMLQKKRLEHLGMSMRTEWDHMQLNDKPAVQVYEVPGKKFRQMIAQSHVRMSRIYTADRSGRELYKESGIRGADFELIGARENGKSADKRLFECPNCGAVSAGAQLTAGCPYCDTRFFIEELETRISGHRFYKDPFFDRELAGLRINGHLNRFAFIIGLVSLASYAKILWDIFIINGAGIGGLPFGILMFISSDLMIFFAVLGTVYVLTIPVRLIANAVYKKAQEQRSEELKVMRQNETKTADILHSDPEFSLHSFLANVRNKVAAVHFADTGEQMEAFSVVDLSGRIEAYRKVFGCVFGPIRLDRYRVGKERNDAEVTMTVDLLTLEGETVRVVSERIRLQLERQHGMPSKNPFGIVSIRCNSCGASVDLTEGNTCTYCGTRWDLGKYDWCITGYKTEDNN